MTVRVLVADDQDLVRTGLTMILDAQPDIEVVGQAADGTSAVEFAQQLRPDVCLVDIRMPGLDGIGLTAAAREMWPGLPVLLTSGYADEAARAAVPGMGVGFIAKPYTVRSLGDRLRELL